MKITALVPAYNEAENIADTILAVTGIDQINQIVVIDDGSTDNTAKIAAEYPVELITLVENQGKGQALNAGWRSYSADIYLLIDADLRASAIYAKELLPPIISGKYDMSIANFSSDQAAENQGKMGFGIAKTTAKWGIKLLTGHRFNSPLSGQRAVVSEVLQSCGGFAEDFGCEVALTIKALKQGYRLIEVDLPMTHRATGRDLAGFKHRGRQFFMVIKQLYKAWRNY